MDRTAAITAILTSLIGAGLLAYVRDAVKAWRARSKANTSEAREALHVATADQSLIVVARARDELAEDLVLLRTTLSEERADRAAERAAWAAERRSMREEIDALEAKLRGLLDEVSDLRRRHAAG
jgi:hypothetical protein